MIEEKGPAEAGRLSWRERQRLERESLILDEAEQLLQEEGYEGLVMDRLADRVGVSKGTLYQHFLKKEDLFGAILLRGLARMDEQLTNHLTDTDHPAAERLGAILTALIERHTSWMATITAPQKFALVSALADEPRRRAAFARFFDGVSALIRQGQERGEFDPAIPAPVAARFLFALAGSRSAPVLCDEAAERGEEYTAFTVRFYLQGLAARRDPNEREGVNA